MTPKLYRSRWLGRGIVVTYRSKSGADTMKLAGPKGWVSMREAAMALSTYATLLYRLQAQGGVKVIRRGGRVYMPVAEVGRLKRAWKYVPASARLSRNPGRPK